MRERTPTPTIEIDVHEHLAGPRASRPLGELPRHVRVAISGAVLRWLRAHGAAVAAAHPACPYPGLWEAVRHERIGDRRLEQWLATVPGDALTDTARVLQGLGDRRAELQRQIDAIDAAVTR